jgi:hypothetical protein
MGRGTNEEIATGLPLDPRGAMTEDRELLDYFRNGGCWQIALAFAKQGVGETFLLIDEDGDSSFADEHVEHVFTTEGSECYDIDGAKEYGEFLAHWEEGLSEPTLRRISLKDLETRMDDNLRLDPSMQSKADHLVAHWLSLQGR